MPTLLLYLLKANVALVLFYLAYHLVLRKLTFYHLNRLFLVFGILFSAVYPLVDLNELFSRHEELAVVQSYAIVIPEWTPTAIPEQAPAFDYWLIPVGLFWLGCGLMLLRLIVQFVSLYRIHRTSVPATYQGVAFRKVPGISEAFSFWKTIYLNPAQHQSPELESILRHEQIHVNGWHTLDVLLAELSTVFYWFNPGVWLMKQAMKENLEFIADQHVVNAGVDRVAYQYLLLKVVGATQPQLANQFNFPSLKRRIAMMNKMPTNKANRLRLLVVLPLVTVLLVAFRSAAQEDISSITEAVLPEEATQAQTEPIDEYAAFYARNPEVSKVSWRSNGKIVVALKSGAEEVYTLGNKQSMASAELKYGGMPSAPPVIRRDNPDQDAGKPNTEKLINQLKQNRSIKSVRSKKIDGKDAIVIALNGGGTEVYFTSDAASLAELERKYVLPELPPPPPPVPAAPDAPPAPPAPPKEEDVIAEVIMPVEKHYIIDGVISNKDAALAIAHDKESIHSMGTYRGESAQILLNDKTATGVVVIITKQNKDSRQVQEFNKKLKNLPSPPLAMPKAPGTPPPPPASGKEAIPPAPPAPAGEQLPPPPPPGKYEGPAIPKAGGARVVETEEHVAYFLWPEEITKRELEVAQQAFKSSGFDLNFNEKYEGGKISSLKIELASKNKKSRASATYNEGALKSILDADNIVIVQGNKKTGEVRIATTLAPR
ncbi:M56 family metallopeptidase [Pontibacter lucknowensis]|uniref:Signal transducer regulating beta-lactamase production, contains metallopeptidase domain n=1 Tax=Pontibacter lucknowensis TaxID=1077936 RepID=A0A1N6TQY7_9BACT|nr:M56 family metallopeptidase [Pontibacter lucknowensis]SIQ55778.1 Signal transducer regulating beta-lactamase production, contains metallopeptidase domain [Pontibacter lucknowensis]